MRTNVTWNVYKYIILIWENAYTRKRGERGTYTQSNSLIQFVFASARSFFSSSRFALNIFVRASSFRLFELISERYDFHPCCLEAIDSILYYFDYKPFVIQSIFIAQRKWRREDRKNGMKIENYDYFRDFSTIYGARPFRWLRIAPFFGSPSVGSPFLAAFRFILATVIE